MAEPLDTQFTQATLNLLRHVAAGASLPVIQILKDQLEARYAQVDPESLHAGVRFLVDATLEGDFDSVLPVVSGMLQSGAVSSVVELEATLQQHRPSHNFSPTGPLRGAGKAYRAYFLGQ